MNDLPLPPADNFYKFLTFSGAGLLLISLVGPFRLEQELKLKVLEAETEEKRIAVATESLKTTVTSESVVEAIRARAATVERDAGDLASGKVRDAKTRAILELLDAQKRVLSGFQREKELRESADTVLLKAIENTAAVRRLMLLRSQLSLASRLAGGGVILGTGLMLLGLYLWYRRVQALQDQLLVLEVQSRRRPERGTGVMHASDDPSLDAKKSEPATDALKAASPIDPRAASGKPAE